MINDGNTDMSESSNSDADIRWGTVKESSEKANKTFYSSFFSEGEEYMLYDNVEIYDAHSSEPHIGKIIKLWEDRESGRRVVLLRWFFRPRELPQLNVDLSSKELFLAFGKAKGVTNENNLEVVCGKCKVLCTSKDPRNRQPSEDDLKNADHYFSKIYNVDRAHLSPAQGVADKLGCDVIFNKQEWVSECTRGGENSVKASKQQGAVEKSSNLLRKENQLSELKKRVRDADPLAAETKKQKVVQQDGKPGAIKRPNSSADDASKTKKLKGSESGKTTTSKPAKVGGTTVNASSKAGKLPEEVPVKDQPQNSEKLASLDNTAQFSKLADTMKDELSKSPLTGDALQSKPEASTLELAISPVEPVPISPPLSPMKAGELNEELVTSVGVVDKSPITEMKVVDIVEKVSESVSEEEIDDMKVVIDDGKTTKVDERKDASLSQPAEEAGGSEKKRLIKASESAKPPNVDRSRELKPLKSARPVSSLNLKKEEDEKSKDTKQSKNDQVKGELSSLSGAGSSLVKKEGSNKEGRVDAAKKVKSGGGVETEKNSWGDIEAGRGGGGGLNAVDKRRLFKQLPWEQNLQQSIPSGKVLLLQNFDPNVTSAEVHEMMKAVFEGFSDARVMPYDASCPYGQALVIFEHRAASMVALDEMEKKCLVMNDRRPLIATPVIEQEASKTAKFPGHLALEKLRPLRTLHSEEYRMAVSTSHCSQPNTIEYEMAMEWRHLQEITQKCYANLLEKQRKEIGDLKKGGKRKVDSKASD